MMLLKCLGYIFDKFGFFSGMGIFFIIFAVFLDHGSLVEVWFEAL